MVQVTLISFSSVKTAIQEIAETYKSTCSLLKKEIGSLKIPFRKENGLYVDGICHPKLSKLLAILSETFCFL